MAISPSFDYFSAQADESSWFPDALTAQHLVAEYNVSLKQQQNNPIAFDTSRLSPSQQSSTASESMSPNDSSGSGLEGSHTPTAWKERRDSNLVLKRSHSTPAVKTMALNSNALDQGAQGEKKRNKLGYHRTSIACSHCRRRKIRCIVSADMQNKCINCVRLKKDCSFHPVDQQHPTESRSKSTVAIPAGAVLPSQTLGSAASSKTPDSTVELNFPDLTASRGFNGPVPILPSSTASIYSDSPSVETNEVQNIDQADPNALNWLAGPQVASRLGGSELGMTWQSMSSISQDSSTTEGFNTYTFGPNTVGPFSAGNSESSSQPDWAWATGPNSRSMSYSGELLGHHQQGSHILSPATTQAFDSNQFMAVFPNQMNQPNFMVPQNSFPMGAVPTTTAGAWDAQMAKQPTVDFNNWQFPSSGTGPN